jgi:catechol 2,3-dioxygenase-like lactoylglutathione lyase family enzyme
MISAKRIGHATFETPDIERQIDYYAETVGLVLAAREPDRAFLASPMGQLAIVLEKGAQQRCARLAFEVARDLGAGELTRRLSDLGLRGEPCSDALPGVSRLVSFADPKGTIVELFSEWSFLDVKPMASAGTGAQKLGHVAFFHPDPKAIADFYARTLGFRVSDWIGDFFVFMRCGIDHHTINFLRGERTTMQHIAFEMRDAHQVHASCDLLARQRTPILWGPVRHGPGHNIAVYHRNPDDQIVELFCELDRMADEELGYFEPRPWHRDRPQKPKVWDPTPPRDLWGLPPSPEFLRPSK